MLVTATTEVVRAMGHLLRRADAGLARGAARNAAAGVAVRQARRLEGARTMRDLHHLDRLRGDREHLAGAGRDTTAGRRSPGASGRR